MKSIIIGAIVISSIVSMFGSSNRNGYPSVDETSCKSVEQDSFIRIQCKTLSHGDIVQKCPFSDTMYTSKSTLVRPSKNSRAKLIEYEYSAKCGNDSKGYQACGAHKFGGKESHFTCDTFVCSALSTQKIISSYVVNKLLCNAIPDCEGGTDEPATCSNSGDYLLGVCPEQYLLKQHLLCNDYCDCDIFCFDEINCAHSNFGFKCSDTILLPDQVCDGYNDCEDGNDEESCSQEGQFFCQTMKGTRMLLDDANRCFPWVLCANGLDQTNCTNSSLVSLKCKVSGMMTDIADRVICKVAFGPGNIWPLTIRLCDDEVDTQCYQASPTCLVHKHQLCDAKVDCNDEADETSTLCTHMTTATECIRRYGHNNSKDFFPTAWILDGVTDCTNGVDENTANWQKCGFNRSKIIIYTELVDSDCEDVFLCSTYGLTWRSAQTLCNNTNPCAAEKKLCSPTEKLKMDKTLTVNGGYRISFCLPGVRSLWKLVGYGCRDAKLPPAKLYGATANQITTPNRTHLDCRYFYGESYVLLSCLGMCTNATCPVSDQPSLTSTSCASDLPHRVYTLSGNNELVFVRGIKDGEYTIRNVFQCPNGKCIGYDQLCNLENDCGDGSDERGCTNHFRCKGDTSLMARYIAISRRCDGFYDCLDQSDELDCGYKQSVISDMGLVCSAWIIGVLAVSLNCFVTLKNVPHLLRIRSSAALMDRVLIILIGLGDMLVGLYLVAIAAVDIGFRKVSSLVFVDFRFWWLSSSYCSSLGIISTTGSQLSLVAMATLSITRVIGITSSLSMPKPVNKKHVAKVFLTILFLVMLCVSISAIPVLNFLEDTFVNALNYIHVRFVKDFTDKQQMKDMLQVYFGRIRRSSEQITLAEYSWLIQNMFTGSYNTSQLYQKQTLKFYGNDPVCLFKFFVEDDDPQILYSWTVLGFNFFCFAIITISYLIVNISSVKSSAQLSQGASAAMVKNRNKKLQRKVSIIIATDFACWMPFIIIAMLHTLGIYGAGKVYGLLSIIILPINSVINPLLYDDIILNIVKKVRQIFTGNERQVVKTKEKSRCNGSSSKTTAFANTASAQGFANTARRVSHGLIKLRNASKTPSEIETPDNTPAALVETEITDDRS